MKILIGTPINTGSVTIQYLYAIRALEERFRNIKPAIKSQITIGSASFMPFSRNAIASVVLEDKSYTHLLFVDSDMGFKPEAVLKLINAKKDIVGCLYPKRSVDYKRFHEISRLVEDPEVARSIAFDYAASEQLQLKVVDTKEGKKTLHITDNGLVRTLRLGMGLTLIRREVIEKMAEMLPEIMTDATRASHYHSMGLRGRVIQCFSSVSVNGVSLSEDLSFCRLWTENCGGEIWACVDQPISHIGSTTFTGTLKDRIAYEDAAVRQLMNSST